MNRIEKILTILERNDRKTFTQICATLEPKDNTRFPFLKVISRAIRFINSWPGGFEYWVHKNLDILCENGFVTHLQGIGDEEDEYVITVLGLTRIKQWRIKHNLE